jgi:pimeloyl-ACP methyl ester carboxylesterase
MQVARVTIGPVEFAAYHIDAPHRARATELVWGHGWGQTHAQLRELADSARHIGPSWLIDFPGFGASPPPPGSWGTAEYAATIAGWLGERGGLRRVWIGHSFGGRVGLQLAARYPALVSGLFLIAAAGVPPRSASWKRLRLGARKCTYKAARTLVPEGRGREWLRRRLGSADYARAGLLRPVLTKVVAEDLSDVVGAVQCPVMLLYGDRDRETPPEIGYRIRSLSARADLFILHGFDHYDILTEGRHQVLHRLNQFTNRFSNDDIA